MSIQYKTINKKFKDTIFDFPNNLTKEQKKAIESTKWTGCYGHMPSPFIDDRYLVDDGKKN